MTYFSKRRADLILKRAKRLQSEHLTEQELYERAKLLDINAEFVARAMEPTKFETALAQASTVLKHTPAFVVRHWNWFVSSLFGVVAFIKFDEPWMPAFFLLGLSGFVASFINIDQRNLKELELQKEIKTKEQQLAVLASKKERELSLDEMRRMVATAEHKEMMRRMASTSTPGRSGRRGKTTTI